MNLLCPNCGKMLTVPEQYAGQLMKCPLCTGTFTVPALPPGGVLDAPSSPQPAFSQVGAEPPHPGGAALPPEPTFPVAPPEPAFQTAPPPTTGPSLPPAAGGPTLPPRPVSSGDYTGGFALRANEQVLQWVPAVALVLVFILQFFPWIGVYVGTVPVATQGAWGAAFGAMTDPNLNLKQFFDFTTDKSLEEMNKGKEPSERVRDNRPSLSLLLLFYMLFFLLALVVTVAVAILPFITAPLPPQVQQLLPWRWAIVAGLNAVLLLFLGLQLVVPFGLESSVAAYADSLPAIRAEPKEEKDKEITRARRSAMVGMVQRTIWLKLAFVLHLLATAAAALVFWMQKRDPAAPPPAIEFRW